MTDTAYRLSRVRLQNARIRGVRLALHGKRVCKVRRVKSGRYLRRAGRLRTVTDDTGDIRKSVVYRVLYLGKSAAEHIGYRRTRRAGSRHRPAKSGQLADKLSKAKLIRAVKLTEVFTALLAAFGFYIKSPLFLIGVIFILGMQGVFLNPVKYAVIPQIVRREQLVYANSLMEAGRYVSILTGTLLGLLFAKSPSLGLNVACPAMIAVSLAGYAAACFITKREGSDKELTVDLNIFKSLCCQPCHEYCT